MKEMYFVRVYSNGQKNLVMARDGVTYAYGGKEKGWIREPNLVSILVDMTDYDEISKEEAEEIKKELDKDENNKKDNSLENVIYINITDFKERKQFLEEVLKYEAIDFRTHISESFEKAIDEASNIEFPIYIDFNKLELGIIRDEKQAERVFLKNNNFISPKEVLKMLKEKIVTEVEDKEFTAYADRYVYRGGGIRDGKLHLESEVEGEDGYHSESHAIYSKEDTIRLFSVISWDEFVELEKKDDEEKLTKIFNDLDIHPETGITI